MRQNPIFFISWVLYNLRIGHDQDLGKIKIPTQNEKRERNLQELVKKNKRPVALFVDEAHDLNGFCRIKEI